MGRRVLGGEGGRKRGAAGNEGVEDGGGRCWGGGGEATIPIAIAFGAQGGKLRESTERNKRGERRAGS